MASKHVDIIIVGAGLIGSTLALALAQQQNKGKRKPLTIALVERSPQLNENPIPNQRVVALGKVATDLLNDLGILNKLGKAFCNSYERMFVWDESSHGELEFVAQEHDLLQLGSMVDSVQCTLLLQQQVCRTSSIKTYFDCSPASLGFVEGANGERLAQLHLTDDTLSAPLIIAADGASSWLRRQAKIFINHRPYQQKGIVARIQTERSHENTAWQRFLTTGPVALLPVENNQSSIVWSADNARATELMALSDDEFEVQLAQALDNELGRVSLLTKRVAFPLVSQKAQSYFARNVALIGDAAHSIHPLAGQGANLGFKDVQALVDILNEDNVELLSDVELLVRYQRKRKADNQQVDVMMSALHHAYQSRSPLWLALRGGGMNVINRSELFKSWLVNQAIGL